MSYEVLIQSVGLAAALFALVVVWGDRETNVEGEVEEVYVEGRYHRWPPPRAFKVIAKCANSESVFRVEGLPMMGDEHPDDPNYVVNEQSATVDPRSNELWRLMYYYGRKG